MKANNEKGFSALDIILVIMALAAIGAAAYFAVHNHGEQESLRLPYSTSPTPKASATATPASTNLLRIPQLGIEITLPNTLTDVVYKVNAGGTLSTGQQTESVTLSTQTLTNLDSDCSVNGSAPALGTLHKTTGQYPTNPDIDADNVTGGLIKQFANYYIGFESPQAECSANATTSNLGVSQLNAFASALGTVQPLQ